MFMKRDKFIVFISAMLLTLVACNQNSSTNSSSSINPSITSETIISTSTKSEVYVSWPTEEIQTLVETVSGDKETLLPPYLKGKKIEIDTESLLIDGFFGIYVKVDSIEAENEYKNILKENNWEVDEEKSDDDLYYALSPNEKIIIGFAYSEYDGGELEIFVSEAPIVKWPAKLIQEYISIMLPSTKTVLPPCNDCSIYIVNYYSDVNGIAINGYGCKENIVLTYKEVLEVNFWETSKGEDDSYYAISKDQDIRINFYYIEEKDEFNIDVLTYTPPTKNWPADEIAALVKDMNLTGSVLPYSGSYNGVVIDDYYYPPCVIVFVDNGTEASSAQSYNQQLILNGYELVGYKYNEPCYAYPSTTLAYRAAYLTDSSFTIELFSISELDPSE